MNPRLVSALRLAVVVVPVAFLTAFFVLPVAAVITKGLTGDDGGSFADLARSSRFRGIIWFTFWQAAASTALSLAAGLPAAAMVARLTPRRQRLVRALVIVPFVLPTVVVAAAFEALFNRAGLVDGSIRLHHTVWAILLAHVFFNYAVVVRTVGTYWTGLDGRLEDQARVLGANRWRTFTRITLPRLRPAIAAAASIVFLFSFTSFGIVLILGGPRRATIETEIFAKRSSERTSPRPPQSRWSSWAASRRSSCCRPASSAGRDRCGGTPRAQGGAISPGMLVGNVVTMVLLLGLPIAVLVERSLAVGSGYSLRHYGALFHRVPQLPASAAVALGNSVLYAVVATALAVLIGLLGALVVVYGRGALGHVFDLGLTLPLGTSAVTIGFGMLLVLDQPPLDLRTSRWIIPIAHALIGIPFVMRTMVPILRGIDRRLRDAAAMLGATPARVRREVDAPIAARGLVVAAAFAFAISLGEFGATAFIPPSGRDAHGSNCDLPPPVDARGASPRPGDGPLRSAHGADRAGSGTDRNSPEPERGDVLMALSVDQLAVSFGEHRAVDGASLEVAPGQILAILGPSGCGKSTLLRAIAGLQPLDAGRICWQGNDLNGVPPHERGVGLMFQDHALFPHRDVAANVSFGLRMQGRRDAARSERSAEMLALVGLSGFECRAIDTLSGGEAQRVALARALAPDPRVLLLDEPFGSLDRRLRDRLVEEIPPILRAADVAAVHVTHDHDEAFAVADRVGIMIDGRIDRVGPPREVWSDPQHASVARFLGHTNLVEVGDGGSVPWGTLPLESGLYVVRADAFSPAATGDDADLGAVVERSVFAGGRTRVTFRSEPGGHRLHRRPHRRVGCRPLARRCTPARDRPVEDRPRHRRLSSVGISASTGLPSSLNEAEIPGWRPWRRGCEVRSRCPWCRPSGRRR